MVRAALRPALPYRAVRPTAVAVRTTALDNFGAVAAIPPRMTLYRSRARRRMRRLGVLAAISAALLLAGAVGGRPALAVFDGAARPDPGLAQPAPQARPTHLGGAGPGTAQPTTAPATAPGPTSTVISSVPGNSVALTIDDGPDPRWTPQVLDLLAAQGIHATFCLIGQEVRAHPDLVRRIVAGGHTLCDHTESHDIHLRSRSRATVDREVGDAYDDIVTAAGGVRPRLFRAPGGNWSPEILAAATRRDMRGLGWDVDTRDWTRPGTAAIAAAVGHAPAGSVILVHDGGGDRSQTVAALRSALSELRGRGFTFVTP